MGRWGDFLNSNSKSRNNKEKINKFDYFKKPLRAPGWLSH